jgi:hypothetical protein
MAGHKKPALTEQEKQTIQTLTAEGRSPNYISKAIGRSRNTITKYLCSSPSIDEEIQEIRKNLANEFRQLSFEALELARQKERLDKMSSYQLAGIAKISLDGARLEEGQSTNNQAIIVLRVPDSREEYEAMLKERAEKNNE